MKRQIPKPGQSETSAGVVFITTLVLLCALCSISYAQVIISGTNMKILSGTTVTSTNNVKASAGGILDIQGTLILKQNLVNENTGPNSIGSGTLELSGTASQSVSGQNIIQNLVVNNPAGISLQGSTRVNGILTLTNGVISLGNNNLTLGTASTVSGSPSATKMIATNGTGQLRKEFSSAGSFTYPVGDITGTAEYSPVTLNFTAGTFGSGNYASVNLTDDKYPSGDITSNYLTRYWQLTQNNITGFTCNATFNYLPVDVTGSESGISCVKVEPLPWEAYSLANTSTHQLSANGLSSFSTFTGAGIRHLTLKLYLEGLYAGSGTMNQARDATGPHFGSGIADQVTVELHNSSNYPTIVLSTGLVNLTTSGDISISALPMLYSGSYYLTVKHRNSIETTSALPVSFTGDNISYNFSTSAGQAYGNNQKQVGPVYVFLGGDPNQDGIVDGSDMATTDNSIRASVQGYYPEDCNGDGIVNASDMTIIANNSRPPVGQVKKP